EHEDEDVRARQLALADRRPQVTHVVDAGRVDELELRWQDAFVEDELEFSGGLAFEPAAEPLELAFVERAALEPLQEERPGLRAATDDHRRPGGRRHAGRERDLADERVDQRALALLDLAHDDGAHAGLLEAAMRVFDDL